MGTLETVDEFGLRGRHLGPDLLRHLGGHDSLVHLLLVHGVGNGLNTVLVVVLERVKGKRERSLTDGTLKAETRRATHDVALAVDGNGLLVVDVRDDRLLGDGLADLGDDLGRGLLVVLVEEGL